MDSTKLEKSWLNLKFVNDNQQHIVKPDQIELTKSDYPPSLFNLEVLNRIQGSLFGLAIGDALGAHVEFRPRSYLADNPVTDLQAGGTWGLEKGQFTDDTSMALCLTNSLIYWRDFFPYDQLVRYKWWFRHGYMSSTGHCFDIGAATKQSIQEFEKRQRDFAKDHGLSLEKMDFYSDGDQFDEFNVNCSKDGVAGNGALMRLAPVPLFFYLDPIKAVQYSGESARITHGDEKAVDACRYYGALIVGALQGMKKDELLSDTFVEKYKHWFGSKRLHDDIMNISKGSYKKDGGYNDGIRGKGYVVHALEAALWAFWSDKDSFKIGALNAVNLGDDTDTTAAIYGQLAGAFYGYKNLPEWRDEIYAKEFLLCLTKWIEYEGHQWHEQENTSNQLFNSSPTKSTTSISENSSRRRFSLFSQRQTNSIGSMSTNVNLIIRKSNNNSGEIGSLYNAHNDLIISSSSPKRNWNINQSKAVEECLCLKGDGIEYDKLFEKFHIDNELQLSLFTNLISPNGFLFFRHYPFLIDEHTRIIFYSKSYKQTPEQMLELNDFQRINDSATHYIQEIDFGIEILILIRLPSAELNYFDQYMDNIKDYLLNQQKLNLDHFKNENKAIFVCSNIDSLKKDNKDLIDILKEINQIKNQSSLYQPINYYLHPYNSQFYPIKQTIKDKLLDILKRFDWIQKFWETKSTFYEHLIQKYLLKKYEELTKEFDEFKENFQRNSDPLKTLIVQCRKDKKSSNELDDYPKKILLKIDFDNFIFSLTCFFEQISFIKHLIQVGFTYEDANIYEIKQDDNSQIIEKKLLERSPNSLFICSNYFLNHSSWKIIHELVSSLPSKKIGRSLIYLDFTYSTHNLDEILIVPANYQNLKLTNEKSIFDDDHQKHVITSYERRSSFDDRRINILLLGKSNVGKSTFINNILNVIYSHSYEELKPNSYFLKIPISFQIQDKHGEEHVIQKGELDLNENYFSSNGCRTQLVKCHSISLNRNEKKNISIIDTPGFQVKSQERYIQQILLSIIHSKRLNAILFLIEPNDNQLDSYRETLKMLLDYFGENLLENVLFCFTKILSSDRNSNDLKKIVNEILSPFNRSVNENSIYRFDSTFLLQSSFYSEKSSSIPKESWQLSKEQFNSLLNNLQENVKPFQIEIPLEDSPLHRVLIKELIRPLLETLRNCLRNEICLERGIKDHFILINAISNEYPHAKCCLCKSSWRRIGLFDIVLNQGHYFSNECSSCLCQSYDHFIIDYQIIYSHSNRDEQTFDKQISLKSILELIKYFSNYLLRQEQTDPFLNYLNQMIDEESNLSHNSFNLSLCMTLQNIRKDYQNPIRQITCHLPSLIRRVQQIPMIQIQLNAAKRIH